jgi:hypothetical protein
MYKLQVLSYTWNESGSHLPFDKFIYDMNEDLSNWNYDTITEKIVTQSSGEFGNIITFTFFMKVLS